jgi:multidrug efflux system outer membrane protein
MRTLLLAAAVCGSVSAACTVGPNYVRPEVPSPPQYRFFDAPEQAESIADLPWWQVFDDPGLQALISEAVANNLDLRVAAARVEEMRARAGVVKSYLYPQIDGVGSYAIRQASSSTNQEGQTGSSSSDDTTHQSGVYGFQLSWELDLFGGIRRQHESALALMLASEQARRGVLVTLVGDVATNYFMLQQLDQQLAIARQTLGVNDQTVQYFRDRLDGGVSNRLELDRIQANRALTASSIPDLERQIALVENLISVLVGRPPAAVDRGIANVLPSGAPAVPAGVPATLLERRPDVLAAEQQLVAANADVGAAKALFFPAIGLTGFLGGVSGDLTRFLGGTGAVWSLGAGLVQPIYNGGRNRQNLEVMRARFDQAVAAYSQAALNGYREVADSIVTIQKLAQARVERETGVVALQDAADLARARYDSGLANYIEILTADQDLFQQQLLLADTRGAELRARAALYRALGGGWNE